MVGCVGLFHVLHRNHLTLNERVRFASGRDLGRDPEEIPVSDYLFRP